MAERLDVFVKEKLNISRQKAVELIHLSNVLVNGKEITKPAYKVEAEDNVEIKNTDSVLKYVSRGGYKLERAMEYFNISLENKICVDIGASTGGFTDCMLQNGASKVYACDVGSNQLVDKIKNNDKVITMENTDIRVANISDKIDFISCDVSFISLQHIIPSVYKLLSDSGCAVLLIKPQFEAGKAFINKNGIVKNPKVHIRVIKDILEYVKLNDLYTVDITYSPIKGGDGNIEYLIYIQKSAITTNINITNTVDIAFKQLK